jgi:hypothetical protein
VSLGAEGQEYVQVLRGSEVDDSVVVRGADEVHQGDKV